MTTQVPERYYTTPPGPMYMREHTHQRHETTHEHAKKVNAYRVVRIRVTINILHIFETTAYNQIQAVTPGRNHPAGGSSHEVFEVVVM